MWISCLIIIDQLNFNINNNVVITNTYNLRKSLFESYFNIKLQVCFAVVLSYEIGLVNQFKLYRVLVECFTFNFCSYFISCYIFLNIIRYLITKLSIQTGGETIDTVKAQLQDAQARIESLENENKLLRGGDDAALLPPGEEQPPADDAAAPPAEEEQQQPPPEEEQPPAAD